MVVAAAEDVEMEGAILRVEGAMVHKLRCSRVKREGATADYAPDNFFQLEIVDRCSGTSSRFEDWMYA